MQESKTTIGRKPLLCLIALCVLSLLHSSITQLSDPLQLNWDPSMYLHFAQMLLNGGIPYDDFVDINPPLIIYLSAIPASIAHMLDVHIIVIFKLVVGLLSFFSFGLIFFAMRKRLLTDEKWLYIASVLIVIANFGSCLGREYGQREQIFLLMFLPFFFVRWMRWQKDSVHLKIALTSGAMAAVGLCLKPHFLIIPILCELFWLLKHRTWKNLIAPETISCVIVGCLYPLHFLLAPNAMRTEFSRLIEEYPLYQAYFSCPLFLAALLGGKYCLEILSAFLASVGVAFAMRKRHDLIMPLIIFTVAGYVSNVVQQKVWDYYKIPLWIGVLMLFGVIISTFVYDLTVKPRSAGKAEPIYQGLIYTLTAFALVAFSILDFNKIGPAITAFRLEEPRAGREPSVYLQDAFTRKAASYPTLAMLMRHVKPGDCALMICEVVLPQYPAFLQYGLVPGCRYPFQFPLIINKIAEIKAEKRHAPALALNHYRNRVAEVMGTVIRDEQERVAKLVLVKQDLAGILAENDFGKKLLKGFHKVETYTDEPDFAPLTYDVYIRDEKTK